MTGVGGIIVFLRGFTCLKEVLWKEIHNKYYVVGMDPMLTGIFTETDVPKDAETTSWIKMQYNLHWPIDSDLEIIVHIDIDGCVVNGSEHRNSNFSRIEIFRTGRNLKTLKQFDDAIMITQVDNSPEIHWGDSFWLSCDMISSYECRGISNINYVTHLQSNRTPQERWKESSVESCRYRRLWATKSAQVNWTMHF